MARARRAPFFEADLGVFGGGRLTDERPRKSWPVSTDDQNLAQQRLDAGYGDVFATVAITDSTLGTCDYRTSRAGYQTCWPPFLLVRYVDLIFCHAPQSGPSLHFRSALWRKSPEPSHFAHGARLFRADRLRGA